MYVQTVRQSFYETRRPEQPHSPIRRYTQGPQGPAPRPGYMESCPDTALLYVYGYVYVYVCSLSQSPRALYLCAKSPPIVASGIQS